MTLRDELRQMISGRGLSEDEIKWIIEEIIKEAREYNAEIKDDWDTDVKDIKGFQDPKFHDAVLSLLWDSVKLKVREVVYWRMELLTDLIQQFRASHP